MDTHAVTPMRAGEGAMKVVILAGGLGTRLAEETQVKPKPMIEIGEHPILWHIMKMYGEQGFNEFIVCLGYKGYLIKEYFANYFLHNADVTFDLRGREMVGHENAAEPWRVTLVDTGAETQTGGRLFVEKPTGDGGWMNGGFFVLEPEILDHIAGDEILWEKEPLERLAREGQLAVYRHRGFWQPMDTLRDKRLLEQTWESGAAPWKIW